MLDHLIESKNHLNENRRRDRFFLSVFSAVTSLLALTLIYSLFSYNLVMAGDNLDVSSLVAPVSVSADAPQPIYPKEEIKQNPDKPSSIKLQSRTENIQRDGESPIDIPKSASTERNLRLSRPNAPFTISPVESTSSSFGTLENGRNSAGGNRPLEISQQNKTEEIEKDAPPVMKTPTPKPAQTPPPVIKSGKVLNGQAINLVKPLYPATARAIHASGAVSVQVTIDENGNVVSANAVSGHPLLRHVSEQAARASKFSPTYLGNQKVKVTGVIVYNFIAQ